MSSEYQDELLNSSLHSAERLERPRVPAPELADSDAASGDRLRLIKEWPRGKDPASGDDGFYRWSNRLSAKLIDLRQGFGGDLDQFLLQLVFVQAEMSRALDRSGRLSRATMQNLRAPGLNALSVAEITSISRETTRRKLGVLAEGGFLHRGPDGLHYLSERYGRDRFLSDFLPLYRAGQVGSAGVS